MSGRSSASRYATRPPRSVEISASYVGMRWCVNPSNIAPPSGLCIATQAEIRWQTAISDGQFLRSMIAHHAGAILMCEQAPIQDPEIKRLCSNILKGQQAEIDQMKA